MTDQKAVNRLIVDLADPSAAVIVEIGSDSDVVAQQILRRNPTARYVAVGDQPSVEDKDDACVVQRITGGIETPATIDALDTALNGEKIGLLILNNALAQMDDPEAVLRRLQRRMSSKGRLILSFPNIAHWSVIESLIAGDWPAGQTSTFSKRAKGHFTEQSALRLLNATGWTPCVATRMAADQQKAQAKIAAFAPMAQELGLSKGALGRSLTTDHWVLSAAAQPAPQPIFVNAIGIRSNLDSLSTVRLKQPLDSLRALGKVSYRLHRGQFQFPNLRQKPGIFLSYRLHPEPSERNKIAALIKKGWLYLHDVDDHPAYLNGQKKHDFRSIREAHAVTVSTPALAQVCAQWNPNVFVVPNQIFQLPPRELALATREIPVVFWGAINRSSEWGAGVQDALIAELKKQGWPVSVISDDKFGADLGAQVRRHGLLDYSAFHRELCRADAAFLPLADSEFAVCKSDLKIIECLASGVVPICSSFAAAQTDVPDELLLIADTLADWVAQLRRLEDRAFIARIKADGYDWVSKYRMWAQAAPKLSELYDQLLDQRETLEAMRQDRMRMGG